MSFVEEILLQQYVNSQVFKLARQTTWRKRGNKTFRKMVGAFPVSLSSLPHPPLPLACSERTTVYGTSLLSLKHSHSAPEPSICSPYPRLSTLRPAVISSSLLSVGSLLRPTVQGRINRLLPIKCSFVFFYCISAFSLPCQCLLPSMPCQ